MNRPIHFEILAEDPQRISVFYSEMFGWKVATWQGGPQQYWLINTGPQDAPGINGGLMHRHLAQAVINTVEVESLDAMVAKLESLGGKKVHGPEEIPGVGTHAYCADPEGNLFGMLQPPSR
jgi:predicted enzyme related to lactoylglutathione lyase